VYFFRVDLLGPFVQILELISQDEELKKYLSRSISKTSSLRDPTITQEDLPEVIYKHMIFLMEFTLLYIIFSTLIFFT